MNMGRDKMRPRKIGMLSRTSNSIEGAILMKMCRVSLHSKLKCYKLRIDRRENMLCKRFEVVCYLMQFFSSKKKANLVIGMQFDLSIRGEIIWF